MSKLSGRLLRRSIMPRLSYIVVWTQLVYFCLAVLPASIAQSLAQATPSLLQLPYNDTSPLATLASKM